MNSTDQLAPTVQTQELNTPTYIPSITNEVAAFVGYFEKGPVNSPVYITDVNQFKHTFGRGIGLYHSSWYTVYNYLQYSSGIWVNRASGWQQSNANNLNQELQIIDLEDFNSRYDSMPSVGGVGVFSRTPGESGNLLNVAIFFSDAYTQNTELLYGVKPKDVFTFFESEHIGIVLFRNDQVVEKYYYSTSEDISARVNNDSKYIFLKIDRSTFDDVPVKYAALSNGYTSFASDEDFRSAYNEFTNKDLYSVDIIIGNEFDNTAAIAVAESRRDCIAFIGLPTSFTTFLKTEENQYNDVIYTEDGLVIALHHFTLASNMLSSMYERLYDYIDNLQESQFVHFTANVKEQVDGFTGKKKLVNLAGDAAGLKARASLVSPWTPGAGLERGVLLNGERILLQFDKSTKSALYRRGCNLVEDGMITSQKTFTRSASSFGRVNIRSLFNHIEKTVEKISRKYIFEENLLGTRRVIALEIKNILNDVKANRGIEAGRVDVNPDSTDPRAIIVDVYIKPTFVSEFIQLRIKNIGTSTISSVLSNTLG